MKTLITQKELKNNHNNIIAVNYCGLQTLLSYIDPDYYVSSRLYGWKCDCYVFDNCVLTTGYGPIGRSISHQLIDEYEQKAKSIIKSNGYKYSTKALLNNLLNEFIKKVVA